MRVVAAVVVASLGALGACREAPPAPETTVAAVATPALQVELAGCAGLRAGPQCELDDGRALTLWIPASSATARLDQQAVAFDSVEAVQEGLRATLTVPPKATFLEVRAADARWSARLVDRVERPDVDAAKALRAAGDRDGARARVEAPAEAGDAHALSLRGRLKLSAGDTKGAVADLERAVEAHAATGERRHEAHDRIVIGWALNRHEADYEGARRWIASAAPALADHPEGAARAAYHRALVDRDAGDLRSALDALGLADRAAERVGPPTLQQQISQVTAPLLQQLGHGEAAEALLRPLVEATSGCARAGALNTLAWSRIIRRLAARPGDVVPDARPHLEAALPLFQAACPDPGELAHVRINLALAQALAGDLDAASVAIDDLRSSREPVPASVTLWAQDVRGRVALGARDGARALDAYTRLADLAQRTGAQSARWRAALGTGLALRVLGRKAESLQALYAAEDLLDEAVALVPLDRGAGAFLAGQEEGARALLRALVEAGRPAAAMLAARRARARATRAAAVLERVRALAPGARRRWEGAIRRYRAARAEREAAVTDSWRLPADQLPRGTGDGRAITAAWRDALSVLEQPLRSAPLATPGPGELVLIAFPLERGWLGLASLDGQVRARELGPLPRLDEDEAVATWLLEPFSEELAAAARLTWLPHAQLSEVPVHRLPWRSEPLVAQLPVAWSTDLAPGDSEPAREGALVVGDPAHDLPAARAEAEVVAAILRQRGQVQTLVGDAVDHGRFVESLAAAAMLHYAGHGAFEPGAGWQSRLPLARGGALTVTDVLALDAVPPVVVLSACETGRGGDAGMGLATAFLASGAGAVVATTEPVRDDLARRLSEALHREAWDGGAAAALRRAQLELRAADAAGWAAYRVTVRSPGIGDAPGDSEHREGGT